MLTLRLARAFTGKKKMLKFWGHFHGLHDYVMYNVHAPQTSQKPGELVPLVHESAGIPDELDSLVLVVPRKDEEALENVVREEGDQIAGKLYSGLAGLLERAGVPARVQGPGARFAIHFGFTQEVKTYADTLKHDGKMAAEFLRA